MGKVLLTASQSDANSGVAHRERMRTVSQGENKRGSQPRHELEIHWANFWSAAQDTEQSKVLSHHSLVVMHEGCSHLLALSKHECADRKASWASLGSALLASALRSSPVRSYLPMWTAQP